MSRSSFHIPRDESIADHERWVKAPLMGTMLSAWLQAKTPEGFWVQFDADAPFRLVDRIEPL